MKRILAMLIVLVLPATAMAQSDLDKVLRGLRQVQEIQKQIERSQRQPPSRPPGNRPPQIPAGGDPNKSGDRNSGGFGDPNRLFPGQPSGPRQPRPGLSQPSAPSPSRTYSQLPIVIHCAADVGEPCRYSLVTLTQRSFPYVIQPGQQQTFPENTDWNFSYQPTGTGPWRTYRLRGGRHYEIRRSDGRWQLYLLQ